ncbi:MAG: HD domain-containing protein [bacterium]
MIQQKELNTLAAGDKVNHFVLLNRLEVKTARNNKPYLNLIVSDKSASLSAKMWDNFDDFILSAKEGNVIKILGLIDDYQGQMQIKIEKIRLALESDNVIPGDFLPSSNRDLNEMTDELETRIKKILNPSLKKLIQSILSDERFEKYIRVPAGKSWHHAYLHGLLEHTLEIIRICDLMCDIHENLNRDLLISGAILHDLGKTEELTIEPSFDYTDKGRLLGHIVIAANIIESETKKIKNFPEELKTQLLHLVLSHQGKLEQASPVEPKTVEAIVLYHADELSAKTNAYKSAVKAEEKSGNKWTKYIGLINTSLFIPGKDANQEFTKEDLFDN